MLNLYFHMEGVKSMNDWLLDMAFSILFTTLKNALHNDKLKNQIERVVMKLRIYIDILYPHPGDVLLLQKEDALNKLQNGLKDSYESGVINLDQYNEIFRRAVL